MEHIRQKLDTQTLSLKLTTASTWGASLQRARNVYTAVIRAAIGQGAPIYHEVPQDELHTKGVIAKDMKVLQNKCLRTITGAYKATPIRQLETEAFIPPIDIWFTARTASFHRRLEASGMGEMIRQASSKLTTILRKRRWKPRGKLQAFRKEHFPRKNAERAINWLGEESDVDKKILSTWQARWTKGHNEARRKNCESTATAAEVPPDKKVLKLHNGLHKAESAILVQLRTEKIGLRDFLVKRRVPNIDSPQCECNQGRETVKHVILHCPNVTNEQREDLRRKIGNTFVVSALKSPKEARKLAR